MLYQLILEGLRKPPLTMNDYRRVHWSAKVRAKREIHYRIKRALQTTPVPSQSRARISIVQYAPDARIRDADDLNAFRKDALDALVMLGVFPDDNTNHVIDGGNTILLDRDHPRIEIRIEPTP